MTERNIGIIGDGGTDRAIFKKICECILSDPNDNSCTLIFTELKRQTIHDYVDRYCKEIRKTNDVCYLTGEQASQFRKSVTNTLYAAFAEFESEIGVVNNKDILLLTTDSETVLANPDDYFRDWRFSISKILWGSIEEFYRAKARDGYAHEYLPFVIPVVTFPSTETFVVAAKDMIKNYGKKPSELKQALYGTTNLQTLREEDLKAKALDFITPDSISKIFKAVPESRSFIQMLAFGR